MGWQFPLSGTDSKRKFLCKSELHNGRIVTVSYHPLIQCITLFQYTRRTKVARKPYLLYDYIHNSWFTYCVYPLFTYPRFYLCHDEPHFPIRRRNRSCRAASLSCARSFPNSFHHFGTFTPFPISSCSLFVLAFPILPPVNIHGDFQVCNPRV